MSPRDQLLKMQRIILRELKLSVYRLEGNSPPEIKKYSQAYRREITRYQKISSKAELLKAVRASDIVFGADFHPFAQSQRTHLRILREVAKNKRPLVLALEAIDARFQKSVDLYMAGKIDDMAFLRKINYSQSWGFPWENYKILFDFAKLHHIPVFGINHTQKEDQKRDLSLRDAYSAEKIAALRAQFNDSLIYVIYGDLHLASSHLPRLTKKIVGRESETRYLTVFQDSESLYWRLAKRNLEERVEVLKLREDAYCVVNSPPWLKWQAYLHFLEKSTDENASDLDYHDHILQFVKILENIFQLPKHWNDFHVFTPAEIHFAQYISKSLSKSDLAKVMRLVRYERSFFIPHPAIFYLHTFDVNHVVSLVGQYIHAKLRREKKNGFQFPRDFVPQIWLEAVGFFSSKLVNHRRKFSAIKNLPQKSGATLIALEQRLQEQMAIKTGAPLKPVRRHKLRRSQEYFDASRAVGSILGSRMYTAFHRGELSKVTLQRWLKTPVEANPRFFRFYMSVIKELRRVPVAETGHNERL